MIHLEGNYSEIVQPDVHYIKVDKDYSNLDEVVERMRDKSFCLEMRKRAYDEFIACGKYTFKSFVEEFDQTLDLVLETEDTRPGASPLLFHLSWYRRFGQNLIPIRMSLVPLPVGISKYLGWPLRAFRRMYVRLSPGRRLVRALGLPPKHFDYVTAQSSYLLKVFKGIRYLYRSRVFGTSLSKQILSVVRDAYRLAFLRDSQHSDSPTRLYLIFCPTEGNLGLMNIPENGKPGEIEDSEWAESSISVEELHEIAQKGEVNSIFWVRSSVTQVSVDSDRIVQIRMPGLEHVFSVDVNAGLRFLEPLHIGTHRQAISET